MDGGGWDEALIWADWWRGADERRKRVAVGTRRYSAVSELVDSPGWEHFVDPEGHLVPADALKAETPAQRKERVEGVRQALAANRRRKEDVGRYGFEQNPVSAIDDRRGGAYPVSGGGNFPPKEPKMDSAKKALSPEVREEIDWHLGAARDLAGVGNGPGGLPMTAAEAEHEPEKRDVRNYLMELRNRLETYASDEGDEPAVADAIRAEIARVEGA